MTPEAPGGLGVEDRGRTRVLTLARPERRNALTPELMDRLVEEVRTAEAAPSVRALVITGLGDHFSAGGDADAVLDGAVEAESHHDAVVFLRRYHAALEAIWDSSLPVVGAVRGAAYGGAFNLLLACDLVVADPTARFCQVFLRRDVAPDMGGAYLLPRVVGLQRAADLLLRGTVIDAATALRDGIVFQVVDDDVVGAAVGVAEEATTASAGAVAVTKRLLHLGTSTGLHDFLHSEAFGQALALRSDEARAGFSGFRTRPTDPQP